MRKTTLLLSALVPVSSFWVPKGFLLRPCSNAAGLGGPAVIRQRFQIARISRSAPPSSSAAVIHHHSLLRMQPPPPPPHGAAPSLLSLGPPLLTAAAASITSTKLLRLVQLPLPLLYSLLAGLSTCLGAAVVFLVAPPVGAAATTANNNNSNNTTGGSSRGGSSSSSSSSAMMAFALSLAGSVMVTVSAVSLLPEAFSSESGGASSWEGSLLSLALGCGLCGVLSQMAFPEPDEVLGFYDKHNNMRQKEEHDDTSATTILTSEATTSTPSESAAAAAAAEEEEESRRRAWRLAVLLFVSLLCHNFPEGCAVAASTSVNPRLGVSTSLAIALHNVPEGVAIAVPALRARPDRPGMAFGLASLSGLAEPVGAAVTLALIQQQQGGGGTGRIPSLNNNDILAFVAGIMMTVAIRELFPEAWRHSKKDAPAALVAGTATGIVVMLATEMFLQV